LRVYCARCGRAGDVERPNDWNEPRGWLVVDTPELSLKSSSDGEPKGLVRLCVGCTVQLVTDWLKNLDPATVRRLAKGALVTHLLRMAIE
jgi:hypothetical protein